ncbi:hypothetical protein J6590_083386 [Homalodisca vitripennis]|nr:hypothetical protein J6590_083386 [Homalodisca vitripennis]
MSHQEMDVLKSRSYQEHSSTLSTTTSAHQPAITNGNVCFTIPAWTVEPIHLVDTNISTRNRSDVLDVTKEQQGSNSPINVRQAVIDCLNTTRSTSEVLTPRKRKVLLMADNCGHHMFQMLESHLGTRFSVTAVVRAHAPLRYVVLDVSSWTADMGEEDIVVIMGGTNDIGGGNEDSSCQVLRSLLDPVSKPSIIVTTIPYSTVELQAPELETVVALGPVPTPATTEDNQISERGLHESTNPHCCHAGPCTDASHNRGQPDL